MLDKVRVSLELDRSGQPSKATFINLTKEVMGKAINLHPNKRGPGFHGHDKDMELWVFTQGAKLRQDARGKFYIYGYAFDGRDVLSGLEEMLKMLQKVQR